MEEEQKSDYNDKDLKVIHTYTSDMADAVRTNEASVIKIALAEKAKREEEELYTKEISNPVPKVLLLLGGLIFIGIAITTYYFVAKRNQSIAPLQITQTVNSIIPYDSEVSLDITNDNNQIQLSDAIKKEVSSAGNPGSIKYILLKQNINNTPETLRVTDFISLMNLTIPSPLIRSLTDQYMLGTYTPTGADQKQHLFIIFKTKDYNQAYASMLSWEKTMLNDLFYLFNVDTTGDRSSLLEKPWNDILLNNKDARILYDKLGNDILYYMFPDKETLIITDNQDTIKEINNRILLQSTKPLQ